MRSNRSALARASPAGPSTSTITSCPSGSTASTKRSAFMRSSSTSSTRTGRLLFDGRPQTRHQPLPVDRLDQVLVGAEGASQTLVVFNGDDDHRHVVAERPD